MCFALAPLQVPDMIRKVDVRDADKSMSGPQKRLRRQAFRTEADKRGVDVSTASWSQWSVADDCIRTVAILYEYKKACS